jgi:hypothetical protein
LFTQLRVYPRYLRETKTDRSFFFSHRNRREAQNQTTLKHNALYFLNAPRSSHEVKGAENAKVRGDSFYTTQRFSAQSVGSSAEFSLHLV